MKRNATIKIVSSWEYDYLVARGYEPLMGFDRSINAIFEIEHGLRRQLQDQKFKTLDKFYRTAFKLSNKVCEETGIPIENYSAVNISHIISRGADIRMWNDLRNFNLLLFEKHQQWETGNRKAMKIYPENQIRMQKLKLEYNGIQS